MHSVYSFNRMPHPGYFSCLFWRHYILKSCKADLRTWSLCLHQPFELLPPTYHCGLAGAECGIALLPLPHFLLPLLTQLTLMLRLGFPLSFCLPLVLPCLFFLPIQPLFLSLPEMRLCLFGTFRRDRVPLLVLLALLLLD